MNVEKKIKISNKRTNKQANKQTTSMNEHVAFLNILKDAKMLVGRIAEKNQFGAMQQKCMNPVDLETFLKIR